MEFRKGLLRGMEGDCPRIPEFGVSLDLPTFGE